ncbi:MAG: beta-(1-6) glucans synthase [Hyphomicrobiaceae bacterium]|nr:beta-(1-6) glucans synthase [Hyphomicrobiaceae bacterium]
MRNAIGIFVATCLVVVLSWWWRGQPVPMPDPGLASGDRLDCLSYAPFRDGQTPLDPTTVIPPAQIEEDLARLALLTGCVRIYSVDMGLDRVPELAARHNLQVLLGIWISGESRRNREQIAAAVALANRHPDTVRAVIVGNEVLLRGEQSAQSLQHHIATVRSQVRVPVTYADVWEFWLRNRELATAVDFVTIHILPYWEDIPIGSAHAAAHIASIRARVAAEFPGKDILIGEAGWPSRGRMREGARPSPVDQARVLHDLLAASRAERFRVNFIEALDQPWKRHLEGTVGGYWGLLTTGRQPKFAWGRPVTNYPLWPWQAAGGVVLVALVFVIGLRGRPGLGDPALLPLAAVGVCAGALAGEAVQASLLEGLGPAGWIRAALQSAVALVCPLAAAAAVARRLPLPAIQHVIGPPARRRRDPVSRLAGAGLVATCLVAVEAALGLVFNPRYLDFPYAALTSASLPFLVASLFAGLQAGRPQASEAAIAVALALSALFIAWNETLANWQALWLAAALLLLSFTLARARAAPG